MALSRVEIDPIKYLQKLPTYDGNFTDLYMFIDLIDRIGSVLETYDNMSQTIFLDIIKSKLLGTARDVSDINNHLTRWTELKEVLVNNFGDRLSVEQLYDKLRSIKFKTNAKNFYDEIITCLRRLNMKTRTVYQNEARYNELIIANKRTALDIFKNKLLEPMRSIIICRNPNNVENAMKIIFDSNYAYFNPIPNTNANPNQKEQKPTQNQNQNTEGKFQKSNNNRQTNTRGDYQYNYRNYNNNPNTNNTFENQIPYQNVPFQNNNAPNRQNFNGQRSSPYVHDNDRPKAMEIGNFHQDISTNSPT